VKPVTANSSRPIRLTAELIQCHMCSCFSQKAFRLFLVAGREDVGACIAGVRERLRTGSMRAALSRTILNYNKIRTRNRARSEREGRPDARSKQDQAGSFSVDGKWWRRRRKTNRSG